MIGAAELNVTSVGTCAEERSAKDTKEKGLEIFEKFVKAGAELEVDASPCVKTIRFACAECASL